MNETRLTIDVFNAAIKAAQKNPSDFEGENPRQANLADFQRSRIEDNFVRLIYVANEGNWRSEKWVTLAFVPMSIL